MSAPPPGPFARLLAAIRALLGTLILVGVGLNFANVVGRYVFRKPIIWAEEILVFIMIWCVLLGATLVTWEGSHLKMDAVHALAPRRLRRVLNLVAAVAFLFAAVFVLAQSIRVLGLMLRTGQKSVVAEIPMIVPYGVVPLSFAIIVAILVWRFRAFVRGDTGAADDAPAPPRL
jgi:C4-dicarboxylate transporter DctQ subunit